MIRIGAELEQHRCDVGAAILDSEMQRRRLASPDRMWPGDFCQLGRALEHAPGPHGIPCTRSIEQLVEWFDRHRNSFLPHCDHIAGIGRRLGQTYCTGTQLVSTPTGAEKWGTEAH